MWDFFFLGNSFYCFVRLYCFSCLTVKPPWPDAKAQIYVQLDVQCQGVGAGGRCWKESCLVFPALCAPHTSRSLQVVQDCEQRSRTLRKGYPSNGGASHLHQCLQEGTAWISHSFIQNPLPNSVTVGIHLLLRVPTLPLASRRPWTSPSVFLGFSFLTYKKGWVISALPTS